MSFLDSLTGAEVGLNISYERVHSGMSYIASYKTPDASPVADNAQIDFLIIVGTKVPHFTFFIAGNGDIETAFYEGTVVTNNGTQVPIIGLNRQRTLPQTVVVWRDPTITTIGDLMLNTFTSMSCGPGNPREEMEFNLRPSTNYLLRATNREGSAQPMSILINWHEFFA